MRRHDSHACFSCVALVVMRLRQVCLPILYRLGHDLSLVALVSLALIVRMVGEALFLSWFESVFDTTDLTSLVLPLAYHLWTTRAIIDDELLAASLARRRIASSLVVAHRRHPLVGDTPQIAAALSIETYVVFLRRLHKLRLVHNLADLFLKKTVWHTTSHVCRTSTTTTHRVRFLWWILLLAVIASIIASYPRVIFLKARTFALLVAAWEERLRLRVVTVLHWLMDLRCQQILIVNGILLRWDRHRLYSLIQEPLLIISCSLLRLLLARKLQRRRVWGLLCCQGSDSLQITLSADRTRVLFWRHLARLQAAWVVNEHLFPLFLVRLLYLELHLLPVVMGYQSWRQQAIFVQQLSGGEDHLVWWH